MEPDQRGVPLTRQQAQQLDFGLVPGLRNRLVAELDARHVSSNEFVLFLHRLTGRAKQTVARWIDADHPGLPDPASLAVLSLQLDVDTGWLLGLTSRRMPFAVDRLPLQLLQQLPSSPTRPAWFGAVADKTAVASGLAMAIMNGHDMAPRILHGSPYFYDPAQNRIACNGIYVLEYLGQTIVRHVELQVGAGVLLRCENSQYDNVRVDEDVLLAEDGVCVRGRVTLAINVCDF
jgi:DNA-binding transcriptional LysR family regulator